MSTIPTTTQFDWTHSYPAGVEPAWEVALLFPPQGSWSIDEYLELTERTNQLVEFTAGKIEVLEMPNAEHQLIVQYLLDAIREAAGHGEKGIALTAPHPTTLGVDIVREPDIVFKLRDNLSADDEQYFASPDLVIEVVSPDKQSRKRDYERKRKEYAIARVAEYWIIDPQEQRITVLALEGDNYVEHSVAKPGEQATSRLLDGFAVDTEAVFAAGKKR